MSSPFSSSNQDDTEISADQDGTDNDMPPANEAPVEDKFGDEPLNQVVSDPSTYGDIIRWQCSKCKYTYEGREDLEECPKCGASKEFFSDI